MQDLSAYPRLDGQKILGAFVQKRMEGKRFFLKKEAKTFGHLAAAGGGF